MILEPPEPSNFALGMKILFMLIAPVIAIYWIRSLITPTPSKPETPPPPPKMPVLHRFRPRPLRYCVNHLTNIPKGRIALIVEQSRCELCKLRK